MRYKPNNKKVTSKGQHTIDNSRHGCQAPNFMESNLRNLTQHFALWCHFKNFYYKNIFGILTIFQGIDMYNTLYDITLLFLFLSSF